MLARLCSWYGERGLFWLFLTAPQARVTLHSILVAHKGRLHSTFDLRLPSDPANAATDPSYDSAEAGDEKTATGARQKVAPAPSKRNLLAKQKTHAALVATSAPTPCDAKFDVQFVFKMLQKNQQ